jgi:hypothetical protein
MLKFRISTNADAYATQLVIDHVGAPNQARLGSPPGTTVNRRS